MLLSPNQIEELLEVIEKNHLVYIGTQIGTNSLSRKDKSLLKTWGVDWKKLPKESKAEHAFKFGLLSEALGDTRAKKLDYKQLKKFIKSGGFIPLSSEEKLALDHLKYRGYSDIKRLGARISNFVKDFFNTSFQKRREAYEKIIRETGMRTIIDRTSVSEMKSEIGNRTGDWARDLDRVVDTVMHETYNMGRIMSIRKEGGDSAKVWHQVYSGACTSCIDAYLTGGIGSKPKVFTVKELLANGNNYHRKKENWKATPPPLHPYCRCHTVKYNEGYVWSEDRQIFVPPKTQKRRARAKVTISKN